MSCLVQARICLIVIAAYLFTFSASASDTLRCAPPPLPGSVGNVAALIMCINNANAFGGGVIDLGGFTYTLTSGPFESSLGDGPNGLPDILSTITIQNGTITRDPSSASFRILHVSPPGSLSLKGVTLSNGNDASGNGGGAILVALGGILGTVQESVFSDNQTSFDVFFGDGGAINLIGEFFAIEKTVFSNNFAASQGGAISTSSVLGEGTISESIFVANNGAFGGGAIALQPGASISGIVSSSFIANVSTPDGDGAILLVEFNEITFIDRSSFSFNTAAGSGGAISIEAGPEPGSTIGTVSNSTFNNNQAQSDEGGAISVELNGSITTIYNCTFNQNLAQSGGAVAIDGFVAQFFNNTVVGNQASFEGGGIFLDGTIGEMVSNIVAGNLNTSTMPATEDDVFLIRGGTITSFSFNLIGSNANNLFVDGVDGNIVGTPSAPIDPNVGVLRDNGGPTFTMAPLTNSPAIGAGDNPLGLEHDQRGRGFARTIHAQTDIGAVEVQRPRQCPCRPEDRCRPDDCRDHQP